MSAAEDYEATRELKTPRRQFVPVRRKRVLFAKCPNCGYFWGIETYSESLTVKCSKCGTQTQAKK